MLASVPGRVSWCHDELRRIGRAARSSRQDERRDKSECREHDQRHPGVAEQTLAWLRPGRTSGRTDT
jgi:hypothetical protein